MKIQPDQAAPSLRGALEEHQKLVGDLIGGTVDRLHTGMKGMTPMIEKDYLMQKAVLNAAYTERGVGTKLNITG